MSIEDVLGANGGDSGGSEGAAEGGDAGDAPEVDFAAVAAAEREELKALAAATIAKTPAPAEKKAPATKLAEAIAKPAPPGDAEPAKADADGEKELAARLRRREAENAQREELRKGAEELKAARAQIAADAAEAKKHREESAALLDLLRKDPAAAIKKAGWDPDDLVLNLANGKSPGAQAQREALTLKQELEDLKAWRAEQSAAAEKAKTDAEAAEKKKQADFNAAQIEEGKRGFLKVALDAEKFPALADMYGDVPEVLIAKAERVANAYYDKTKEYAKFEEIAEYLNSLHSKPSLELSTPTTAQRSALPAERAPGKRTLTPDAASQRRTVPDPDAEPTRDELVALSKKAVNGAHAR